MTDDKGVIAAIDRVTIILICIAGILFFGILLMGCPPMGSHNVHITGGHIQTR